MLNNKITNYIIFRTIFLSAMFFVLTTTSMYAHDLHLDSIPEVTYLDSTSRSIRLNPTTRGIDIAYKRQLSSARAVQIGFGMHGYSQRFRQEDTYEDESSNSVSDDHYGMISFSLEGQYLLFKPVEPDFFIYWGPGLSLAYQPFFNESRSRSNVGIQLNGTAGFEWFISKKLSLIGETQIYVSYQRTEDNTHRESLQIRTKHIQEQISLVTNSIQLGFAFYLR